MKNSILIILLLMGIMSCDMFKESFSPSELDRYNWQDKLPDYAKKITLQTDEGQIFNLSRLGFIHNEVLEKSKGKITLDNCSIEEIQKINTHVNSILKGYPEFQKITIDESELETSESFIAILAPCEIRSKTEFETKLRSQISKNIEDLKSLDLLHEKEIEILKSMLFYSFEKKQKPPMEDYIVQLKELEGAYMDGLFTLSMIAIFEYSSVFWDDYKESIEDKSIQLRGGILGAALVDWGGAMLEGYAWIYENRSCVECGDANEFLEQVGKGAVGSSAGPFGSALNRWIFD